MKSPRLLLVLGLYALFAWQVTAADSSGNSAFSSTASPNTVSQGAAVSGPSQQRAKTQTKHVKRKKAKLAKHGARGAHKPAAPRTPLSN